MKARMICDLTNEVSVKYSELAIDSFKNTDLEIERVQCVTPETIIHQDFELKFGLNTAQKWVGQEKQISASEQACFASHFREWKLMAETNIRHIIMEHDAFLWEGMEEKFNMMMEYAGKITMWNPGIAMECYTMAPKFAEHMWVNFDHQHIPVEAKYPRKKDGDGRSVSAGPMAELLTYAKYYYIMYPRVGWEKGIGPSTWMWPDGACRNTVITARDVDAFKKITLPYLKTKDKSVMRNGGLQTAPVTQVFCPNVKRTIDHEDDDYQMNMDGYNNSTIRQMKVIDKL